MHWVSSFKNTQFNYLYSIIKLRTHLGSFSQLFFNFLQQLDLGLGILQFLLPDDH